MEYKDKNWLEQKYCNEKLSAVEISKTCNVTVRTIYNWMIKHHIERRKICESKSFHVNPLLKSKEWLYEQYVLQSKTIKQIEKEINETTVQYWLKKHKIKIRKSYEHFKPKFGKDNCMYNKIGDKNHFYGKKHNIETKLIISRKNRGKNKGQKNSSWNGGKTSLYDKIRKCNQYKNWRSEVFEKDNFTCVFCGYDKGSIIEADHIKPFALILQENNIKTIYQAYNCEKLWSVDNGRTLCKHCHRKTKTWGNGTKNLLSKTRKHAKGLKNHGNI